MPASADRIELILEQLDALPTLSAVAVRVIELTRREDADSEDLIHLISSDPALAARVLKLAGCVDRARAATITTVERAVLHLGFEAVRSVALSVGVFDHLDHLVAEPTGNHGEPCIFDRRAFWRHSLAVASTAEQLAKTPALKRKINPGEAFLAGLLHDLGLLALHTLLPRSLDRVCRLAQTGGVSIEQACSRIIGITPHTAGRRLAERWRLPRPLIDVLWLAGQRFDMMPDLPHGPLVKLITLADAVARGRYITPVGHTFRGEPIASMAADLDLDEAIIDDVVRALPSEVANRAEALGLDLEPDAALLLESVSRANESLGRLNATMRSRAEQAERRERVLCAILSFHESMGAEDSIIGVLGHIVASAAPLLGRKPGGAIYQADRGETWRVVCFGGSASAEEHGHSHALEGLSIDVLIPGAAAPQPIAEALASGRSPADVLRLLPIPCRGGLRAAIVHEDPPSNSVLEHASQLDALGLVWAGALEAAVQRERAGRLAEALAQTNRNLSEAHDELARRRASIAVGEIVAGAAHEMNNPLTIVSGRAQQLAKQSSEVATRAAAEEIVRESHRLSDMLTMLRTLTEQANPQRRSVDLGRLVMAIVQQFQHLAARSNQPRQINTVIADSLPHVLIDPEQIGMALAELIRNAVESKGSRHIEVRVQSEGPNDRLRVQVRDDGAGFTLHALTHAFEPFFSSKGAGRQSGLGLAHARRYVEAHGGRITLENVPNGGAVATIWLENCFVNQDRRRSAA